jgi:parallel beta helix pectate lyase-like protein
MGKAAAQPGDVRHPAPPARTPHPPVSRSVRRVIALAGATLVAVVGCTAGPAPHDAGSPGTVPRGVSAHPPLATRVCDRPVLNSPYDYDGAPGSFRSGTRGLPTYGTPGSDFPNATAGAVLPAGRHSYLSYQLQPDTVYYLLPGTHTGFIQADKGDAFVGGWAGGVRTVLSGDYAGNKWAIDSNFSDGNQPGVVIEYLTIEKFQPPGDGAAINQSANTNWMLRHDTVTLNVPGAGMIAGSSNVIEDNCLTLNGQYGFQSSDVGSWGRDSLTDGPYNVTIKDNEISYNDTCDFEGLLSNPAIGWSRHNPVPVRYRNPHCGPVTPDGNEGGFKLWQTNGVTIEGNYIHHNWGPGIWADTNNANTTYTRNVIAYNDGQGIIEEISYNFSITENYLAQNGWAAGLGNFRFPTPAIYISESGSDTTFGGVPACREASCSGQGSYPRKSVISRNTLVNNSGSVFLWQSSDRFCSAGFDNVCTLVRSGRSAPFTLAGCKSNLPSASINPVSYVGRRTGRPPRDWWDGCVWRTANVSITSNVIDFDPAGIPHCNRADWPDCGAGGIFSEYGVSTPYKSPGEWAIASQLTFFQHNTWAGNVYRGPSRFYAWAQGNGDSPLNWSKWTGQVAKGDKCSSADERQSGACPGPFGQDSGSTYTSSPAAP